jgi:hypothetical protein
MKTLHIFDFDDTLIRSESQIRITHVTGQKETLTSEEYAKYTPTGDEIFDFSDFDEYPTNPQIIEEVFAELRSAIALDGPGSVVILTARSNPLPVSAFLRDNNISGIEIQAVGDIDPMKKAKYVLARIKNDDFEEVRVFEDNVRNIRTIRKVVDDTGIKFQSNRVTKSGVYRGR